MCNREPDTMYTPLVCAHPMQSHAIQKPPNAGGKLQQSNLDMFCRVSVLYIQELYIHAPAEGVEAVECL